MNSVIALTEPLNPAIVIGGGSANGLGIARNLGCHGIPVYCLTSNPQEWTIHSKYCTNYAIIPEIESNPTTLQRVLARLRARWSQSAVLFPTTDTALLTLATLAPEWSGHLTFLPKSEVLETCVFKHRFYRSLMAHGVPHPRTLYPEEGPVLSTVSQLTFPVFIRPSQSLRFFQAFNRKGWVAHNAQEVQKYLQYSKRYGFDMMVQEIIPGTTKDGYALRGYIDRHFRLIALFATQKARKKSAFTNPCVKMSIPLTQVSEAARSLLKYLTAIQYQGIFMAEFKQDARDKIFKLLEINARSAGGHYLAIACGVNHILAAYRDTLGEDVQPITVYESGRYHIDLTRDLPLLFDRCCRNQLRLRDLHPYLRKKAWQFFSMTDLPPFLHFTSRIISSRVRTKLTTHPSR